MDCFVLVGFFGLMGNLKASFHLQFKILNVPMSSQLAANHWNQQQAEQEERMRMKKLTLDINERQEQEDYQGKKIKYLVFIFSLCGSAESITCDD